MIVTYYVLVLLLACVGEGVMAFFDSSKFYQTCNSNRTRMREAILRPTVGVSTNPSFLVYDLSDKTKCLGRVPHMTWTGEGREELGWVNCSSPRRTFLRQERHRATFQSPGYVGCYKDVYGFISSLGENLPYRTFPFATLMIGSTLAEAFWSCRQFAMDNGARFFHYSSNYCHYAFNLDSMLREGRFEPAHDSGIATDCSLCTPGDWRNFMCGGFGTAAIYEIYLSTYTFSFPEAIGFQHYHGRPDCHPQLTNWAFKATRNLNDRERWLANSGWTINSFLTGPTGDFRNPLDPTAPEPHSFFNLYINGTNELIVLSASRETQYEVTAAAITSNLRGTRFNNTWASGIRLNGGQRTFTIRRRIIDNYRYSLNIISPAKVIGREYGPTHCSISHSLRPEALQFDARLRTDNSIPEGQTWSTRTLEWELLAQTKTVSVYEPWETVFSAAMRFSDDMRLFFVLNGDTPFERAAPEYSTEAFMHTPLVGRVIASASNSMYQLNAGDVIGNFSFFGALEPAMVLTSYIRRNPKRTLVEIGGRRNQAPIMFTTVYANTWQSRAQVEESLRPDTSRFVGDVPCDCGFQEELDDKGRCVPLDWCPTGLNIATCGPRSTCISKPSSVGHDCKCTEENFAYDILNGRRIRSAEDINPSTGAEIRNCSKLPYTILITRFALKAIFDLNFEYHIEIGQTNQAGLVSQFSRPVNHNRVALGNRVENVYYLSDDSDMNNGREFYVRVLLPSRSNSTIIDYGRFQMPCSCSGNAYLDWRPAAPRRDDGRPINGLSFQDGGSFYVEWTDDSLCATRFSLDRVYLTPAHSAELDSLNIGDDAFALGDLLAQWVARRKIPSLSLISDYLMEASDCGKRFGPLKVDDLRFHNLPVGSVVAYCMTASGSNYKSSFHCTRSIHSPFIPALLDIPAGRTGSGAALVDAVRITPSSWNLRCSGTMWEARFMIRTSVGKHVTYRQADDVLFVWNILYISDNGARVQVSSRLPQFGKTGSDGLLEVHIQACKTDFPFLSDATKLVVELVPSKIEAFPDPVVANATTTLVHQFLCHSPLRECSTDSPLSLIIDHDSRNTLMEEVRDISEVTVVGKVTMAGTELDGEQEGQPASLLPDGCPVSGAEVCAYSSPGIEVDASSIKFSCGFSDARGFYAITVPLFSSVVLKVSYNNHTFTNSTDRGSPVPRFLRIGSSNLVINFKDTAKEWIYVDVVAGLCDIPIASEVIVVLSKERDGCGPSESIHWVKTLVAVNMPLPGSDVIMSSITDAPNLQDVGTFEPSISPTQIPTTATKSPTGAPRQLPPRGINRRFGIEVPATFFEVRVKSIKREGYTDSDALSVEITSQFDIRYRRDESRTVNLTNPDREQGDLAPSASQARRLARFQYDVDPEIKLEYFWNGTQIGFTPETCPSPLVVVGGQQTQEQTIFVDSRVYESNSIGNASSGVIARLSLQQSFAFGQRCSKLEGSLFVMDTTFTEGNGCEGPLSCSFLVAEIPSTNGTGNERGVRPLPNKISPFSNDVTVSYTGPWGLSKLSYRFKIIVLGHAHNPNQEFDTFDANPIVLTVVRDPPGDMSKSFYANVETSVTYVHESYEVFAGGFDITSAGLQIEGEAHACAGLFFMLCTSMAKAHGRYALMHDAAASVLVQPSSYGQRTMSRTFTWSMETSASPGSYPGSDSDMFLVHSVKFLVIPTFFIEQGTMLNDSCSATLREGRTVLDMEEARRRLNITDSNMNLNSVSWLSRRNIHRMMQDFNRSNPLESDSFDQWLNILAGAEDPLENSFASFRIENEREASDFISYVVGVLNLHDVDLSTIAKLDFMGAANDLAEILGGTFQPHLASLSGLVGPLVHLASALHELKEDGLAVNSDELLKSKSKVYAELLDEEDLKGQAKRLKRQQAKLQGLSNPTPGQLEKIESLSRQLQAFDEELANINERRLRERSIGARIKESENRLRRRLKDIYDKFVSAMEKVDRRLVGALAKGLVSAIPKALVRVGAQVMKNAVALAAALGAVLTFAFDITTVAQNLGMKASDLGDRGTVSWRFLENSLPKRAKLYQEMYTLDGKLPKYRPLPDILSLWDGRTSASVTNRTDPALISFSGGGALYTHQITDQDDALSTLEQQAKESDLKFGFDSESKIIGLAVGASSDSKLGATIRTKWKRDHVAQIVRSTSAGFTLGDSTPGDEFTVRVLRDEKYGTFAFTVIGGRSKCPAEVGTIPREAPILRVVSPPPFITHPTKGAAFYLSLENQAIYDVAVYQMTLRLVDLEDNAKVFVDGVQMTEPRIFGDLERLMSYPVLVEVFKGMDKAAYNIHLELTSLCDLNSTDAVDVPIVFAPSCPAISLAGAVVDNPVILAESLDQTVQLMAKNLAPNKWSNHSNVNNVRFEYLRYSNQDWSAAISIPGVDLRSLETVGPLSYATYPWDLSGMDFDSLIRVRAVVDCNPGPAVRDDVFPDLFHSYSAEAIIRIDRVRPQIYSIFPQRPFPGVDEILITFTEPIRCGPPLPFQAQLFVEDFTDPNVIFTPNAGHLLVRCEGDRLAFTISRREVRLYKLLGKRARLVLTNIRDMAGNKAYSNAVSGATAGLVEYDFTFADVALEAVDTTLRGLKLRNVDASSPESSIKMLLSQAIGVPQANIEVTRFVYDGIDYIVNCVVQPVIASPLSGSGRRLDQNAPSTIEVIAQLAESGVLSFTAEGSLDAVPVSPSDLCEAEGVNGTTRMSSRYSSALHNEIASVQSQLVELEAKMNRKLEAILAAINNTSASPGTLQQQLEENAIEQSVESMKSAQRASIAGIAVLGVVLSVLAITLVGALVNSHKQLKILQQRESRRAEHIKDVVVVGDVSSGDLTVMSYNPTFSPHPVFGKTGDVNV